MVVTNCRRTVRAPRSGRCAGPDCPDCCAAVAPDWLFGTLAILLCLVLGVAIVTQVRQTKSGDSLDTARPADLLVLLDSLRQREATLNTEVSRTAEHAERVAGLRQH